jgi:hypothetical protein
MQTCPIPCQIRYVLLLEGSYLPYLDIEEGNANKLVAVSAFHY